jgi:hypothetical protein
MDDQNKIDEKTLIPISFLLVILGGVFWLSTIHSKVSASEKQIEQISSTGPGSIAAQLKEHGESLARIEGALGTRK